MRPSPVAALIPTALFALGAICSAACAGTAADAGEAPAKTPETTMETVDGLLDPFWRSATMRGEALFFAERKAGEPPMATLAFPPEKVQAVKSATGETTYEEGRDYAVDKVAGVIRLLPGSRIPTKTFAEMFPPAASKLPKIAAKRGEPGTHLIWSESRFFHDLQVEVTYSHAPGLWKSPVPAFAGAALERTVKRLGAKEPLKLCLLGDSISQGYNASGLTKAPPRMPPYGELVALGLERAWGAEVEFRNFAIAGWRTENGLAEIAKPAAEKPDLAIIAFGMNDSAKNPAQYAANVKAIMEKLRAASPEVEFVLVSPMLPNPDWSATQPDKFPAFRDELARLCGPGVALADLTSVWAELLKRKGWHDLTGNGVNHPNDFGHRLYAQVILALLVDPDRKPARPATDAHR